MRSKRKALREHKKTNLVNPEVVQAAKPGPKENGTTQDAIERLDNEGGLNGQFSGVAVDEVPSQPASKS